MKAKNLLCLLCAAPSLVFAKQKPNIIFILVDDLGKEWFDVYGGKEMILENINALSKESMVFHRAYSMPQSTPSRAAIMTSQYPYNNGWINHYDVPRWGNGANFDPNENPCHSLLMQKAGYKTCAVGKWQLNDFRIQPNAMNEVGFDEYFMWTGGESGNKASNNRYWNPYIHSKEGSKTYEGKFGPDLFNQFVLDFLTENKKDPMYVYYPMVLTHGPKTPTPLSMNAKTKFELQSGMIRYMDFLVGKLVAHLKDIGIYDNTCIIFSTDNGSCGTVARRDQYYIQSGKTMLSENGVNAPFIVKIPHVNKRQDSNALVNFVDIGPTALDLAGAKHLIDPRMDGISFVPALEGKANAGHDWTVAMGSHPSHLSEDLRIKNTHVFRDRAIITNEYKVIISTKAEIEHIYNINVDPYELKNLVSDAAIKAEVEVKIAEILADMPKIDAVPKYTKVANNGQDSQIARFNKRDTLYSNFRGVTTKGAYDNFMGKEKDLSADKKEKALNKKQSQENKKKKQAESAN